MKHVNVVEAEGRYVAFEGERTPEALEVCKRALYEVVHPHPSFPSVDSTVEERDAFHTAYDAWRDGLETFTVTVREDEIEETR